VHISSSWRTTAFLAWLQMEDCGAAVKRISEGDEPNAYFSAYFVIRLVFTILVIVALLIFREYFADLNASGMIIWLILLLIVSLLAGSISSGVVALARSNKCHMRSHWKYLSCNHQVVAIYLGMRLRTGWWSSGRITYFCHNRIPLS